MKANLIAIIQVQDRQEAEGCTEDMSLNKGDIVLVEINSSQKSVVYSCCPGCGSASFSGNHKITNENGLITAHPSLVYQCCGWHGFLEKGIFRSV